MPHSSAPPVSGPDGIAGAAHRGVQWFGIAAGVQLITSMAKLVILARSFEVQEIGLMAMLVTVSGYLGVLVDLQLPSAIIQRVKPTRGELSSVFWFGLAFGILLAAVLAATSSQISNLIRLPMADAYLKVLAIGLVLTPIAGQFQAILRKQLDFRAVTVAVIASTVVDVALLAVLVSLGWSVWAVVVGQLASIAVLTLIVAVAVRGKGHWPTIHFRWHEVTDFLSFGVLRVGARLVAETTSRLDVFIIQMLIGAAPLGFYNIASRLVSQPAQRIAPIVNQVGFPVIASVRDDRPRILRGFLRSIGLLTGLFSPIMLGLASCAPALIEVMLGDQWLSVTPLVQALAVAALFRLINSAGGNVVLAMGKASWTLYFNLGALVLTAGIVYGAAVIWRDITSIGYALIVEHVLLGALYYHFYLRRLLGGFLKDYLSAVFHPLGLATLMAAGVWIIGLLLEGSSAVTVLAVQVISGMAAYLFLLVRLHRSLALEIASIFLKGPLARLRIGPLRENLGS